jgi:hypothetical protein
MMEAGMRLTALLLCAIGLALALPARSADTPGMKTVYVLPMANGLDQYLANRINASGLFQVAADPKKAEAVFTDRLGETFEQRMNSLFPPAKSAEGEKAQQDDNASRPASSFSRRKGTIFLVEAASRIVVWSTYHPPRNTTPPELDRTAQRIVEALMPPSKK